MSGLIGRKIGMTSIFDENGKNIPCTVIECGPCVVTQVRTNEVDGYSAIQLGFDDKAEKRSIKAELGHFKKAGTAAKKKVVEFKGFEEEYKLGDVIAVDLFAEGEFVDVVGVSKGKGFQGVVKRYNFKGGPGGHGSKFHRALGSIGTRKPRRTKPGKKMHGRHGNKTITLASVPVELIDAENNIVAVRGPVPGAMNTFVYLVF